MRFQMGLFLLRETKNGAAASHRFGHLDAVHCPCLSSCDSLIAVCIREGANEAWDQC